MWVWIHASASLDGKEKIVRNPFAHKIVVGIKCVLLRIRVHANLAIWAQAAPHRSVFKPVRTMANALPPIHAIVPLDGLIPIALHLFAR